MADQDHHDSGHDKPLYGFITENNDLTKETYTVLVPLTTRRQRDIMKTIAYYAKAFSTVYLNQFFDNPPVSYHTMTVRLDPSTIRHIQQDTQADNQEHDRYTVIAPNQCAEVLDRAWWALSTASHDVAKGQDPKDYLYTCAWTHTDKYDPEF